MFCPIRNYRPITKLPSTARWRYGGFPLRRCRSRWCPLPPRSIGPRPADFYRQLALNLQSRRRTAARRPVSITSKASATKSANRWKWRANTRCEAAFSMSFRLRPTSRSALSSSATKSNPFAGSKWNRSARFLKINSALLLPLVEHPRSRAAVPATGRGAERRESGRFVEPGRSVSQDGNIWSRWCGRARDHASR